MEVNVRAAHSSAGRIRSAVILAIALGAMTAAGPPAGAADLSGCWQGTWESCTSGHQGPLNATFCRVSPTQYDVRFSGRFFKFIPFHYSVTLNVESEDETSTTLAGSHYLGRMVGTFTFRANATATSFVANYSSCKDQGKFVLSRCCSSCGQ
jgi:hypothetical protein